MTDPVRVMRTGIGTEMVGMPQRTRHLIAWTGVTMPSPDGDDYSSSPVELATSEPGTATFTHTYDANEFYYPIVDGVQLDYLPYNGHFRPQVWVGVKNDNASAATVTVKMETVIDSDTRKTTQASASSSITTAYYACLHGSWHPWAYGTNYSYRYTGLGPGDTLNLYLWSSQTTVKVHYVHWGVFPVNPYPRGGSNEANIDCAWPYSDFLLDVRGASSAVDGPYPTIYGASSVTGYFFMGNGSGVYVATPPTAGVMLGLVPSERDSGGTSKLNGLVDAPAYWADDNATNVQTSANATSFAGCSARRFSHYDVYFTGLPGRAASWISGDNISGG